MMRRVVNIFIFLFFFLAAGEAHAAPVKILIVPGHDNQVWGAQYKNIKEADMNLALATELYDELKADPRFEPYITRNDYGYLTDFTNYFNTERDGIAAFRDSAKAAHREHIADGSIEENEGVPHNSVAEETSIVLYGINRWADHNHMDAVIHVHFNDYPRKRPWIAGKYQGFAIYAPESQMAHSKESTALATDVWAELKKNYATSTYPPEKGGLVPDQSLIALGASGTLLPSVRSILVEYGYIYRFSNSAMRHKAYTDMAHLTANGIKDYFFAH
ncbi:MAG: N-acetylmuramoyl-L-alanine amidase [bacterium]